MKPNIFDIATKELNQDAFITWLLQYADEKCKDADIALNQCGKDFVTELICSQVSDFSDNITKVRAGRQWEHIDVWAEVNDKYLIIIEDKTGTSHHSNQLFTYKGIATDWCVKNNYKQPICIYLKTGNESQSSLKSITAEGFSIFNRQNFINLLSKHNGVENDIFKDFRDRLMRMEKSNNEFENKNIGNWNGSDWQGFFQFLEKRIGLVDWNYVNNPNGGFWNAILNWECWDIYPTYLQIEEGKLCFKISTDPEELDMPENITRGEIRNKLHQTIIKKAEELGIKNIRRPNRFGNGKYMTVAIVDRENWLGTSNSKIDKEKVALLLESFKQFLLTIL